MGLKIFSGKCFWKVVAESDPKNSFPKKVFLKNAIKSEIRAYKENFAKY